MAAAAFLSGKVRAGTILLAALAYFCCSTLSLQLTRIDKGIAIVWFAGALLFSALAAAPRRHGWRIALACLPCGMLAIAWFGMGGPFTLPLALIGLAEAWGAAWLMRRLCPRFGRFQSLAEAGWFLAITGLLVPALSAFPGAWCAHLARDIPYAQAWRDWFTAHALGFVAFSPPLLLAFRGRADNWLLAVRPRQLVEAIALLGMVTLTCLLTFSQNTAPLVMVPLVPMTAATVRLGRPGAVISIVILMVVGLTGSLHGYGPTALLHGSMTVKLEVLQLYFACVVLVLLPLAAELEARRRVTHQLRAAETLHRLIIERTSDVTLRLTADGRVRYASPASIRVLGYAPAELAGRCAYDLVIPEDLPAVMAARERALARPEGTEAVEYRLLRRDGLVIWVESHMCATFDAMGQSDGTVTILRDITERRQLIDDLSRKAMTDPLTGLCNRRAFDNALAECMDAGESTEAPGCLALFDLDHFKRINDLHGHATGDRMLVLFTAVLRGTVRGGDIIARLGGEEFAVLLEGASIEQARLVCERIRVRLAASEGRSIAGEPVRATVSVGLAPLQPGRPIEETIKAADAALYQAKHDGRNRLTIAA